MITIGAMTVNEVRERENMNKVDSGDKLYMPKSMETLEMVNKEIE